MKIKDIDLFEEDLIRMMEEFWALDNNEECAEETIKFLNKYDIDAREVKRRLKEVGEE